MSAETLSGAIAAPATSIGIESSGPSIPTPSFGGRIDGGFSAINSPPSNINVGGVNNPDLNNSNIFSLPELKVGSIDTLDKVVPGNLAFTHIEPLWQASAKPTTEPNSTVSDAPTQRANIDTGGVNRADLNSNIFSQTSELKIGSVETFDKVVHGNLAFTHTEILWQADTKEKTLERLRSIDVVPTMPPLGSNQEIRADAEQAARVKNAWVAIGAPEEVAEKSAVAALNEKLQRTDITENLIKHEAKELSYDADNENLSNIQFEQVDGEVKDETQQSIESLVQTQEKQEFQVEEVATTESKKEENNRDRKQDIEMVASKPEKFFEEDANADKAREGIAKKAVETVSKKVSKDENRKINGAEIAEEMPRNPQPSEVISEIIKESRKTDGSYIEMTNQIAGSGEIETPDAAKQIIEKAIQENPAVRITSIKTSRPVAKEDVQKVLGEGKKVVLFNKS